MKIIVGLGNPGEQYDRTRHNAGFFALDVLLGGVKWQFDKKFQALIYEDGGRLYVKPQTYMNDSGRAVRAVLDYYGLLPKKMGVFKIKDSDLAETLTVIHDDLDIDFGKYKIAVDSRSAGHNGVQSIIDQLHTKNFKRVRLGIRTGLLENIPAEKFVLARFSAEEMKTVRDLILNLKNEI
jgi:PTH1 family peptidyl-tRNA hydrolase